MTFHIRDPKRREPARKAAFTRGQREGFIKMKALAYMREHGIPPEGDAAAEIRRQAVEAYPGQGKKS
jgi:hypothetical protein